MPTKLISVCLLVAAMLMGCASTRIISEDANAEIFINEQFIGVGTAWVDRVGPPRESRLEAKRNGQVVGYQTMSRSFTFKTILWGMVSYYTGFYWGWYYPEMVSIPLLEPVRTNEKIQSQWNEPRKSIWMQPLK